MKIEHELEMAKATAARLADCHSRQQTLCQAIETVLEMTIGEASHLWTRQVGAHLPYGGRGNLRKWMRETIQAASPLALDSITLLDRAIPVFGLVFEGKADRKRYYDNTFRKQLFALMQQGSIERLTFSGRGTARTSWRWKGKTTLDALKDVAAKEQPSDATVRCAIRDAGAGSISRCE